MNLGRRHCRGVPSWLVALAVGLVVGTVGLPARAVETPVGSKNFTAPGYVPNYFSNESGAFTGARGGRPAAPVYAAPRVYPRRSYDYAAASHRLVYHRGHAVSRSRYRHLERHRAGAHRHFVRVASRSRTAHVLHARPAAAGHRAVRPHTRSGGRTGRVARR